MKRNISRLGFIFLIISLLALTVFLVFQNTSNPSPSPLPSVEEEQTLAPREICESEGGKWLAEHNECEGIEEQTCLVGGGEFDECESACRHESEPGPCITLCVAVCRF